MLIGAATGADFNILHCPGKKHTNVDALSQLPCPQCKMDDLNSLPIPAALVIHTEYSSTTEREAQMEDPVIIKLLFHKELGQKPSIEVEANYIQQQDAFAIMGTTGS